MLGGGGTQTAGIAFGGNTNPPPASTNATEEYGGTSWTTGGNLGTARMLLSGAGSQDAAIAIGGNDGSETAACELYNGTSWTATASLNATASYAAASGSTNAQALNMGGNAYKTATEEFSNFGEPNSFAVSGQVFYNTTSKEFKYVSSSTVGTWASGGSLPAARSSIPSCGTQTAGLAAGGFLTGSSPPAGNVKADSYEYDGSSWTAGGTMGTAQYRGAAVGTQTAAFVASGRVYSPTVAAKPATEEYDGSSWTTGGALSTARYVAAQGGVLTAGFVAGGQSAPPNAFSNTEEYDGSSFSNGGALSAARAGVSGAGTLTSGLAMTGHTAGNPTTYVTTTDEYNGTSWTSGGAVNQSGKFRGAFGASQTAATIAGGFNSSILTATENYDGTTWATNPNSLPTATNAINNAGLGTQAAGMIVGGNNPDATAATVEYTGADTTNIETVTTS